MAIAGFGWLGWLCYTLGIIIGTLLIAFFYNKYLGAFIAIVFIMSLAIIVGKLVAGRRRRVGA